jgi:hypothetical protein
MAIQNSIPADPRLGLALIGDADRLLHWARAWAAEFAEHARDARVDDAERTLHAFVSALGTAHETLLDATWHLGARQVRDELLEQRRIDPLLAYLWKATQDAVLGRIVAWDKRANATEVVVVDRTRAQIWTLLRDPMHPGRELEFLYRHLYGVASREALAARVAADPTPLPGRAEAAGVRVEFGPATVRLCAFETRDLQGHVTRVPAPSRHLGAELAADAASSLEKALQFYETRVERVRPKGRAAVAAATATVKATTNAAAALQRRAG